MEDQFHNLKKFLKEARPSIEPAPDFEHSLRRALLNSRFYDDNFFTRWHRRTGFQFKTVALPIGGASLVFASMVMLSIFSTSSESTSAFPFSTNTQLIAQEKDETTASAHLSSSDIFNNWYESGRIKYERQNENGTRVYKMKLDNGQLLELVDPSPFTLTLTSAN
jgi:hypothetical protein